MNREVDPIAKVTSFGFTLKGAFERVLSFLAEANPAGKKVACRNQRRIPANAASGLAFLMINFLRGDFYVRRT